MEIELMDISLEDENIQPEYPFDCDYTEILYLHHNIDWIN